MLNLRTIYKPRTLDEALECLKQPGTAVLAGGTGLLAGQRSDVRAVVDLSLLGLSYIREPEGAVTIGATTTLAQAADSLALRAAANGIAAKAARRSTASVLRNQATVGGTLIAEPSGLLAAVLVALEAIVTFSSFSRREGSKVRVDDFLSRRAELLSGAILTEIAIPAPDVRRRATMETVARTPSDKPIVSVCAALDLENRNVRAAAIALGGVHGTAMRAKKAESILANGGLGLAIIEAAARAAADGASPASDWRASAEYRREMIKVLTARVLSNLAI